MIGDLMMKLEGLKRAVRLRDVGSSTAASSMKVADSSE